MSDGKTYGIVVLLIVGVIFVIIGATILATTSGIETTEGTIEDTLIGIPNIFGWSCVIGGIFLIAISLYFLKYG